MSNSKTHKELLEETATKCQQNYYELLPDIVIYQKNDYKYLKQHIGLALFGPCNSDNSDSLDTQNIVYQAEHDVSDETHYNDEQEKVINTLFEKICEHSTMDDTEIVKCGLIYNVIFFDDKKAKKEPKEEKKDKETEKDKEAEGEKDKENMEVDVQFKLCPVPIFTIQKQIAPKNETDSKEKDAKCNCELWFMDTNARIYKNWSDYMHNNTLPQCTMVVPHGGFYQPNPHFEITENYSQVWVDIVPSPSCSFLKKVLKCGDILSTTLGVGGAAALGITSIFTPVGPVIAAAGVMSVGLSSAWTIGRCTDDLRDRSKHDQSIKVTNREALGSWLCIAGSTLGFAASGGTLVLAKSAEKGLAVGNAARLAFNSVVVGEVAVNFVGVGLQGYSLYEKYKNNDIRSLDVLLFASHVLLFGSAVVKMQFARDIIEFSQGKVFEKYEATLRSKRFRKAYKRMMKKAGTDTTHEAATIIRKLKKVNRPADLMSGYSLPKPNISARFENGSFLVNDIKLLDPVLFVNNLIKNGIFVPDNDTDIVPSNPTDNSKFLSEVLQELLSKFYTSDDCPKTEFLPIVSDFTPLLNEIKFMDNPEEILKQLFHVAVVIVKTCSRPECVLLEAMYFAWRYSKENLKQYGIKICSYINNERTRDMLTKIVKTVFIAVDMIIDNLLSAFSSYLNCSHRLQCYNAL